jgi:hypothetical protein
MTTTRIPIKRPARGRFTDEALDLFLAMQRCQQRCGCGPGSCFRCEEWSDLHRRLFELWPGRPRPWWWPVIEHPDVRFVGASDKEFGAEAQQRWRDIEAAAAERERERGATEPPITPQ